MKTAEMRCSKIASTFDIAMISKIGPRPFKNFVLKIKSFKWSVERSRHERHICSLLPYFYFLDFKFSNVVCPSELHPLIWFFLKTPSGKRKYPKNPKN